ncbi:MAG TPA: hypothetical protein VHM92_01750 [Allosphingosinicella sp.]|nr:hypothetical protein [Allosphingosinicella sp.]
MRPTLIALAGLAFAGTLSVSPAPAAAADTRCQALPKQVRAALAGQDSFKAKSAARHLRTGEALCRANNARGGAREFQAALKLLGTQPAGTVYGAR